MVGTDSLCMNMIFGVLEKIEEMFLIASRGRTLSLQ